MGGKETGDISEGPAQGEGLTENGPEKGPLPLENRGEREKKLSITEHLAELRQRMFRMVAALAITATAAFFFTHPLLNYLKRPAPGIELIYTEVPEMFGTYVKLALLSGFALALPYIIYQVFLFIAPGLTRREKRYLYFFLPGVFLFFAAGVAFGYFIMLPPALRFLLNFGGDIARPQIRVSSYVSLVTGLLFWIGLSFELPLVLFLLGRLGIVSARQLARFRRYAFVLAFVAAAIITPTADPINQGLVAGPLVVLYELGILLSRLAGRLRRPSGGQEEAARSLTG